MAAMPPITRGADEESSPPSSASSFEIGVMAIVVNGGSVRAGDPLTAHLPQDRNERLEPV